MNCKKCNTEMTESRELCRHCQASGKLSVWGYFIKCMKNYANFNGRARRREYWSFVLIMALIFVPISIYAGIQGFNLAYNAQLAGEEFCDSYFRDFMIIIFIVGLPFIVPSLAVCFRRLHDIGKSGWHYIVVQILAIINLIITYFFKEGLIVNIFDYIVMIGAVYIFVLTLRDSTPEENEYGPSPK